MASVEAAVFSEFIADVQPRLARAFVAAYGVERGEDALAEALAYAWAHFGELARMENAAGFLFRVGQSKTRRRKRPLVLPPRPRGGDPEVEPGLLRALAQLSERQRLCVVLVHVYEWTQREVADLLGVSASSVQVHLSRGMTSLRREVGDISD
jgi:DNA-directed RNA polymerase specialized sigma24 family protein